MKNLNLICSLAIALILTGCDKQEIPHLKYEKFNDIILTSNYQKKNGVATGLKGVYVMYGKLPTGATAGTAVSFGHKFIFRVKEVTKEYPDLLTPPVQKVIDSQEVLFNVGYK